MVDIADVPFSAVPDDEQALFLSEVTVERGDRRGYKPRQLWVRQRLSSRTRTRGSDLRFQHLENGVRDQIQNYASMFYCQSCCGI